MSLADTANDYEAALYLQDFVRGKDSPEAMAGALMLARFIRIKRG